MRVNNQHGFFLLELLVASTIMLLVIGMFGATANFQKRTYLDGATRSRISQNLRGTLDIIGTDIRIGGENLTQNFPAFLLTSGAITDSLTVRRSILDEALPICVSLTAGSPATGITVSSSAVGTPGCTVSGNQVAFDRWKQYRLDKGGSVFAYLYNITTKQGEFFTYSADSATGALLTISRPGPASGWLYSYTAGTSVIYMLESWQYQVTGDELQVIQNDQVASPLTVMFGVKDFEISAIMQDGSTLTSMTTATDWTDLKYFEVELKGEETSVQRAIEKTVVSRFFPRNILSF